MSEQKTVSEKAKEKILDLGLSARGEDLAKETEQELLEKAKDETKTGRKSKDAKDAENTLVIAGGLETIITGINAIIASKLPELNHEPEEIKTISTLGAPVLNKYVDLDAIQYKDEVKLLSYLFMCESKKVEALTARLKKEAKQKRDQAKNEKDKDKAIKSENGKKI